MLCEELVQGRTI